ncbi:hypothetical protein BU24DRAFT_89514 [Aaosphaeria arxii CBS 175.79]|uniref:Uncharacterized protein n=1 Tax=Aaosphaeria arxii CBS 175.79 TaxID=1450172 RepID=A0A6A5X7S1_9PLEO|nr:uncharacterized protein BU24DRAFT_89514 [Aaosphaeria arxii CBS 175.79]KAF2008993.1 hypothetical protein BU24DRAFT_89514 [Aaosphaeria arxii CBS 175.79]
MAPKASGSTAEGTAISDAIVGFSLRETKLLAAAFVAMTAPGKINYDLMAELTGNTVNSLRKMFPPIKQRVIAAHPSFGVFMSGAISAAGIDGPSTPVKANGGRKRKNAFPENEDANDAEDGDNGTATGPVNKGKGKAKAAASDTGDVAKRRPGRPRKAKVEAEAGPEKADANTEVKSDTEDMIKLEPKPASIFGGDDYNQ